MTTEAYPLPNVLIAFECGCTDRDIVEGLRRAEKDIVESKSYGGGLTVSGFDDDPREIWQIPEAVELLKRLHSFGS